MRVDLPTPTFGGGYDGEARPRVGFFTDTSVCIGCKACEVACKEWNLVPQDGPLSLSANSYDNTMALGASTWRHVAFIEQHKPVQIPDGGGSVTVPAPPGATVTEVGPAAEGMRWLMSSDVCKHCSSAACLEVCPTGALFRTEFGTVVVQQDICNGCGYCVPSCPFGVIDQRKDDGRVFKCTMCYDRLTDGKMPACATACPTQSIQFGDLDELQARADARLATLKEQGVETARLYLRDENDGVGGAGAFFLLLDEPEVYGLPPDPVVPARDMPSMWRSAAAGAAMVLGIAVSAVLGSRRR
jgi:formate dehydrogenase iron-sulfur subunit